MAMEQQTFTVGTTTITRVTVGSMENNVYLVAAPNGDAILVDAAAEPEKLGELVADVKLHAIITTHEHADHTGALATMHDLVPDAGILANETTAAGLPIEATAIVEDGKTYVAGDLEFDVVELRGHTRAGIALVFHGGAPVPHILTGDSLFPGGVGKTDGRQAFDLLLTDVKNRLFEKYPDATTIHPGHGESATLGAERPHLDEWEERGW